MKKIFLTINIILSFLLISSCNTAQKKPESVVDKFYNSYNQKDFDAILSISDEEVKYKMKSFVKRHYDTFGEIKSRKLYNTKEDNAIFLYYKCKFAKIDDNVFAEFIIVESNDGYKINGFSLNTNKDIIDNQASLNTEARKVGRLYYSYLFANDQEKITNLLDNEKIINKGFKDNFFEYIQKRTDYYGKIVSYNDISSIYNKIDNTTTIIIFYDCKLENGKTMVEELSFIKRSDGFKIYYYRFAKTIEDLYKLNNLKTK